MPKLSEKGKKLPESSIRKLAVFSEEAKERRTKVFHLNIGQPDIKAPKEAIEVVRNSTIDLLPYSSSEGSLSLRKAVCSYYKDNAVSISPEDVIVTVGASEAISFAFNCICDSGDEIIVPEPFYANYNGFSSVSDVKIVPVISHFEDSFCLPPLETIEEKINSKTKGILICNPSNPTGYLYSKEEIEVLGKIALKYDLYLIVDEVYREFIHNEEEKHYSVLEVEELSQHAIVVDSVSKRFSLCGARVGFLISRNKELMVTALKLAHLRLSPSIFGLMASEAAFSTSPQYLKNVKREYTKRKKVIVEALEKVDNVKVSNPTGAFYCIVELPVADAEDFSKWLLTDFSDNKETVMLAPAKGFYSTPNYGKKQVRIAFILEEKKLLRSVDILKKALEVYPNRI